MKEKCANVLNTGCTPGKIKIIKSTWGNSRIDDSENQSLIVIFFETHSVNKKKKNNNIIKMK